jgi:hypothetical protein
MRQTTGYSLLVMTSAMLLQVACTQPNITKGEDTAEAQQGVITTNALSENALSENALSENALSENALSENALSENALSENALSENALVVSALTDPLARELLKYITSCALPEDAHFDLEIAGVTYGFDGALGLAPEWGEVGGSCDAECRSWISGCVISRLDYTGATVTISLRGDHDALHATHQEKIAYPHREATYFGNIFAQPQQIFACLPPGKTSIPRVCGPSLNDCIVHVVGKCEDFCGHPRNDGSYPDCRDDGGKNNHKQKKGKKHEGSVTVFLP